MQVPEYEVDNTAVAAMLWFEQTLDESEWINQSWIGRHPAGELRMLDIVCGDGTHRLLYRLLPSTEPVARWDDLDYEGVRLLADQLSQSAREHGFMVGEFAGAVTSLPGFDSAADVSMSLGTASLSQG